MRTRSIAVARPGFVLGLTFGLAGFLAPGRAAAVGTVDLSWDACAPIVSERIRDGAHPYSLYATVLGHDAPHREYEILVQVEWIQQPPLGPYPDAWRFDAAGCQTSSRLQIDGLAPAAVVKTCPSFFANQFQSVLFRDFRFNFFSSTAHAFLANRYPETTLTTNPDQRYFLARFEFDHTFSVVGPGVPTETCGGSEADLRLRLIRANWAGPEGIERNWAYDPAGVTFCGSCTPTPATNATWGLIKGQYRR